MVMSSIICFRFSEANCFQTHSSITVNIFYFENSFWKVLSKIVSGATNCLEWKIRFKVALGVSEGLHYLHCECKRRIIHRDITASNILLTQDYEPQVLLWYFYFERTKLEVFFISISKAKNCCFCFFEKNYKKISRI